MASELIGPARCPLCGGKARLGLAKTLLPVLTCNGCNIQLFARSDRSDTLLRGNLLAPETAATTEPEKPPARPAPASAPSVATTPKPEPDPVRTEKASLLFF